MSSSRACTLGNKCFHVYIYLCPFSESVQAIASSPSLLLPVYINQEPIEQSFCGEGRQYGGGNSVSHIGNHFCMSIMTLSTSSLVRLQKRETSMADAELLKLDCVPQFISSITSSWHWHGKGIAIHPLMPGRESELLFAINRILAASQNYSGHIPSAVAAI